MGLSEISGFFGEIPDVKVIEELLMPFFCKTLQ
jgi:hypothetical protein